MKTKVLVVCHGNINRSPVAAAVLAEAGVPFRSRGLKPGGSNKPAGRIQKVAAAMGYDLSTHRATAVTQEDLDWADVILYMDSGNYDRLRAANVPPAKLLCLAACDSSYAKSATIRDPAFWRNGDPRIEQVVAQIIRCTKAFIAVTP
jgi:protein-tyrosine-phosphatase